MAEQLVKRFVARARAKQSQLQNRTLNDMDTGAIEFTSACSNSNQRIGHTRIVSHLEQPRKAAETCIRVDSDRYRGHRIRHLSSAIESCRIRVMRARIADAASGRAHVPG